MSIVKNIFILFAIVIIIPAIGQHGYAQISDVGSNLRSQAPSPSSYSCILKPGDITMEVNLWGYVRNPGRYEISTSADLVQLLSCAGGPTAEAKLSDVVITRVIKKDGVDTRSRLTVNLDDLDRIDKSTLVLYPGDTIFIDRTGWSSFRDVLSVVTGVAVVTTAIVSIVISANR